jgi:hypothetical protein
MKLVEKEYLEWNKMADSFIHNPTLFIRDNADYNLVFLHNIDTLKDIRNKLSEGVLLVVTNNYNRAKERQSNQINFIIAMSSFVVSFIGLVLALLTLTPRADNITTNSVDFQGLKQTSSMISDTSHKSQIDSNIVRDSTKKVNQRK